MLKLVLEEIPVLINKMYEATNNERYTDIKEISHQLKGASSNMCLHKLKEISQEVYFSNKKYKSYYLRKFEEVNKEYNKIEKIIKRELEKND